MYDAATRLLALDRIRSGESLNQVSRTTGVSRATLREWRERDGAFAVRFQCPCPGCSSEPLPATPYLYLLGQYLGDGCISAMGRTWVLRIATCDAYPGIRDEVVRSIGALVENPVNFVQSEGCTYVNCITRRWLHLFPQHGPGVKHSRRILLERWQRELVRADPRPLVRGLIHSDGWRGTNWTERRVGGSVKRYTYTRYLFSNESPDILAIYTDALDLLGISWRRNRRNSISVARREAVAAMDEFVGPKT